MDERLKKYLEEEDQHAKEAVKMQDNDGIDMVFKIVDAEGKPLSDETENFTLYATREAAEEQKKRIEDLGVEDGLKVQRMFLLDDRAAMAALVGMTVARLMGGGSKP